MHPPHSFALGEAFLAAIVRAMEESPQWPRCLVVITYDEHGGFYDHVPPPICADPRPEFRRLGFRVPSLVIGPTVRRGAVVSTQLEHVSVLATLATRFGIESLGPRMDAANDLSSLIDPDRLANPAPPARDLPATEISAEDLEATRTWTSSQPEMDAMLAAGRIPAEHVDQRSAEDRLQSWLRPAQELEAVKVGR